MRRVQVLIKEPEPIIRLDLRATLADVGITVIGEAGNNREAELLARRLHPELVIASLDWPHLDDDLALIAKLVTENRIPVIVLGSLSDPSVVLAARTAGAVAYLVKPTTEAALLQAIQHALA